MHIYFFGFLGYFDPVNTGFDSGHNNFRGDASDILAIMATMNALSPVILQGVKSLFRTVLLQAVNGIS